MHHVTKPRFVSELGQVDITAITALVTRLSERVWRLEDERKENDFAVFHHTRHIIFRFIKGNLDHRCYYSNPIWDVWRNHLLPLLDQTTVGFGFRRPEYPRSCWRDWRRAR